MGLLWIVAGCALVGFVIGRWFGLFATIALWVGITIFLVVNDGWYGAGWGEFGIAWNVISAILSLVATAGGIGLRRAFRGRAAERLAARRPG